VWIPLTDLQIATKRENTLSCVILTPDAATFADADLFAKSRLDLEIAAIPEAAYYASIGAFFRPIRIMILVTAALVATGGVLGGLNTMYASFASRVREVGMLQSLGYTRRAVVASLAEESLFVAACGALVACVIALLVLDGLAVRFSMGAFALTIDPPVLLVGLAAGLAVGVISAIPPAIRCLRLPIAAALRSH
jgi:putative ABC transport system permease protein